MAIEEWFNQIARPEETDWMAQKGLDLNWVVTAGVLNALWRDVLPRLVARVWAGEASDVLDLSVHMSEHLPVTSDGYKARLAALIDEVYEEAHEVPPHPGPGPDNPNRRNYVYRWRKKAVLDHLSGRYAVPINFPGTGGYDFLIHNDGIDLFYPERETNTDKTEELKDTLDFFTYRQSGRPPVGVPFYCTGGISGVSASSPTGPGQVGLNGKWASWSTGVVGTEIIAGIWPGEDGPFFLRLTDLMSLLSVNRRWQVEGSVYRGIMMELPRQVARIWMELLGNSSDAKDHFDAPGDNGLRSVFRRKLETSLPTLDKMIFRTFTPANNAEKNPWNGKDVVITNLGFFFPEVKDISEHAGEPDHGKLVSKIFREVEKGWAGNPVFTDSSRTEGGGDWGEN